MATLTMPTLKREMDNLYELMPSFTTGKAGITLTLVGLFLNLLNMYTDYALGITYIITDNLWWGIWTLGFVIIPSFFISLYTFILHKKSKGKFLMKVKVSNVMVYSLCAILHGHLARCIMWLTLLFKKIPLIGVKTALWAFRDITSYAETFMQSLPQLCLQLYIIVIYNGDYTPLQAVCFVSSWFTAAWGVHSQFQGVKWKLLAFEINLFWFASRAAAVTMLASYSRIAPFVVITCHFLFMFPLWFWQNRIVPFRRKQGTSRIELIVTDTFYAIIYAGSNSATPITCKYQLPLAFIMVFENVSCIVVGRIFGKIIRFPEYFIDNAAKYDIAEVNKYCTTNLSLHQSHHLNQHGSGDLTLHQSHHLNQHGSGGFQDIGCNIPFSMWIQAGVSTRLAIIVTALGFVQVALISLLRWRKLIDEDAMLSRLGSSDYLKHADGRVDNSRVSSAVESKVTSPAATPLTGKKISQQTLVCNLNVNIPTPNIKVKEILTQPPSPSNETKVDISSTARLNNSASNLMIKNQS